MDLDPDEDSPVPSDPGLGEGADSPDDHDSVLSDPGRGEGADSPDDADTTTALDESGLRGPEEGLLGSHGGTLGSGAIPDDTATRRDHGIRS